jgi:hypothetical protein
MSEDPRTPVIEILAKLRRDYEAACKPWLDMLARYEMTRPPQPILITREEYDRMMTSDREDVTP